jgi:hypothetical protein
MEAQPILAPLGVQLSLLPHNDADPMAPVSVGDISRSFRINAFARTFYFSRPGFPDAFASFVVLARSDGAVWNVQNHKGPDLLRDQSLL